MRNLNQQQDPHWYWYLTATLSAFLCGINCFIVAWDFMFNKTNIWLAAACATAGLILNTALYWREGAQKLYNFSRAFYKKPFSVMHKTRVEICSAVCIGCLTYQSYVHQLTRWAVGQYLPIAFISWTMSVASGLANFALFSETAPEYTQVVHKKTKTDYYSKFQKRMNQFWLLPFEKKMKNLFSWTLALAQSLAYALLNYISVYNILTHLLPPPIQLLSTFCLASTLFLAELTFNYNECSTFLHTKRNDTPPWWYFLLILGNGFANGWIALGDLTYLPRIGQHVIVSIGAFVSFTVMYNNFFTKSSTKNPFIPGEQSEKLNWAWGLCLVGNILCTCFLLHNPTLLDKIFFCQALLFTNLLATYHSIDKLWISPYISTYNPISPIVSHEKETHQSTEKANMIAVKPQTNLTATRNLC